MGEATKPFLQWNNGKQHTTHKIEFLHFLPENLEINASVKPEMKYRGIFETVVYRSVIQIKGNFAPLDWSQAQVDEAIILKELGSLSVGIPDVRGIREKKQNPAFWKRTSATTRFTKSGFVKIGNSCKGQSG